jgi:hypothetical protein
MEAPVLRTNRRAITGWIMTGKRIMFGKNRFEEADVVPGHESEQFG